MKVILFTTHCPKCEVLEKKLKEKNIEYDEVNDTKEIIKRGYLSAPILEVDGNVMDFKQAVDWINLQEENSIGD